MESKKRDYALDFIKFLGILVVVITHYEAQFDLHFSRFSFEDAKNDLVLVNDLFFMLSGYFSLSSIEKIRRGLSFDRYFSSKYLRLVPIAAISTVLYSIMTYILRRGVDFPIWKVIVTALCIQFGGPFNEMFVNSHLWYLSILLICYAVFFVVVRISQRLDINWRYSCLFMVVLGTSVVNIPEFNSIPYLGYAAGCGYMAFFTGVLLADILEKSAPGIVAAITSFIIVAAISLLLILRMDLMRYGLLFIMVFMFFPAIIIMLESPFFQKLLNWRLFGFIGNISLSVYVWHMEFNVLVKTADAVFHLGINFMSRWTELIMVIIDLAIGAASYYLLEKPINRAIKKRFTERRAFS